MFAGDHAREEDDEDQALTVTIALRRIREPTLQGNDLSFLLKQEPKGMVYFSSPDIDGLRALLAAHQTESSTK